MNSKKFWVGTLVAGIVFFFAGYLFYGVLFADTMKANAGLPNAGVDRPMDTFVWWALIAGNLVMGALLSYVFTKANVSLVMSGLKVGFVIGLLMSASFDLMMYATTNLATLNGIALDVAIMTGMTALTGAITVWVTNMVTAKQTVTA
jgi:hypothetical protein